MKLALFSDYKKVNGFGCCYSETCKASEKDFGVGKMTASVIITSGRLVGGFFSRWSRYLESWPVDGR